MDEMTLKLTSKDMDIVANALGQRPYVEVAQLLQKISQQVQQQNQPQQLTGEQVPNVAAASEVVQ